MDKKPEPCCKKCRHSRFNPQTGMYGAWECDHPDNPSIDHAPKTAMMIFQPGKPIVCAIGCAS